MLNKQSMLDRFIDFVDSRTMQVVRFSICIGLSLCCVMALAAATQTRGQIDGDALEHRLTLLEAENAYIIKEIDDMKLARELELLGITGLIGEAGIRIFRRK